MAPLIEIDYDELPNEINCVDCDGIARYQGGNMGTWVCQNCGVHLPLEAAQFDE